MSKPSQRDIAAKADIAVSNLVSSGGYLVPEQAEAFLGLIYEQPTILKQARFVPMGAPIRYVEKIGFGSRILHAAPASGVALDSSKRGAPTTGKITLTTSERIAEVHIPYDVLEDNIEQGGLENTIMSHMASRIAVDLEEAFLLGDTASGDADLALQDGIIKLADSHTVDFSGGVISKTLFKKASLEMPNKFLRNRTDFRFFIAPDQEIVYRDLLADRQTNTGDFMLEGVRPIMAHGIAVEGAAAMPEAKMLFTAPKNLLWGVQRDIMVETDKDIRTRTYIVVVTLRSAFQIEEKDAVVVVSNIAVAA